MMPRLLVAVAALALLLGAASAIDTRRSRHSMQQPGSQLPGGGKPPVTVAKPAVVSACTKQGGDCVSGAKVAQCSQNHGTTSETGLCPGTDVCCLPAPCTEAGGSCTTGKVCKAKKGGNTVGNMCPYDGSTIKCCFDDEHPKPAAKNRYATISRAALAKIVEFEVTSKRHYEASLSKPTWPGSLSGVTIGIGYDLGYNTAEQIRSDWGSYLPKASVDKLVTVAGKTQTDARDAVASVKNVNVPYDAANNVFEKVTLPSYTVLTLTTFQGVEELPAAAQTMMVSLVYNRGTGLDGDRRKEMRYIRNALRTNQTDAATKMEYVASQFEAMKRLWEGNSETTGLVTRRQTEADTIRASNRTYLATDLFYIDMDGVITQTPPNGTAATAAEPISIPAPAGTPTPSPTSTPTAPPSGGATPPVNWEKSAAKYDDPKNAEATKKIRESAWGPDITLAAARAACVTVCAASRGASRRAASFGATSTNLVCVCKGASAQPVLLPPPSESFFAKRMTADDIMVAMGNGASKDGKGKIMSAESQSQRTTVKPTGGRRPPAAAAAGVQPPVIM